MTRLISILLIGLLARISAADEMPAARVGQPLVLEEIFIPGGQLQSIPRRDRTPPLVVRILDIRPAKEGFRYDFEVQGLEPGNHDLAEQLEAVDSSQPAKLPSLDIKITTALPEGPPRPHGLAPTELPEMGGYRTTLIVLGSIWLAGLVGILCWRKKSPEESAAEAAPPTLAERLHPLVAAASAGKLGADDRAKLDRLLIAHWRGKVPDIADLSPAEALATLRRHPESSPLLLALEEWIHSPSQTEPENLPDLLKPYASTNSS